MTDRAQGEGQRVMAAEADRAIDEGARQMTAGEPDIAFRARVLARIGSGATPRANVRAAWVLSPFAAAAAIAIAVFVARGVQPGERRKAPRAAPAVAQTVASADRMPETPGLQDNVRLTAFAKASAVKKPDTTDAKVRLKPDTTYARVPEIDALAPPLLNVTSIDVAPMAPTDSIRVERLDTIAPITVAPLESSAPANDQRPETKD